MKSSIAAATIAATLAIAPAGAQFRKPDDAVRYRQAVFVVMSNHMGRLHGVVQGRTPYEREAVVRSAELVETMAALPFDAFVAGSDLLESRAKPALWNEQPKFRQLANEMRAASAKLTAAAKSGDPAALRNEFQATAKTCDNCHDLYREKN